MVSAHPRVAAIWWPSSGLGVFATNLLMGVLFVMLMLLLALVVTLRGVWVAWWLPWIDPDG